jgi:hypothetical protein
MSKALSDEEAHELLQIVKNGEIWIESLRTGKHPDECGPPPKRSVGATFRASLEFYQFGQRPPTWEPPPAEYRLPLDDFMIALMRRGRSPRIERGRMSGYSLELCGPFYLARWHLNDALSNGRNPARDTAAAALASELTSDIESAAHFLGRIIQQPFYRIACYLIQRELEERYSSSPDVPSSGPPAIANKIVDLQDDLVRAAQSLVRLLEVVDENRSFVRVNHTGAGRPRVFWKDDFVSSMAHLWRLLTTDEPSRTEDSLFGQFVYAAWNSYDEEMPEVSFANAIRNLT